MEHLILVGSPRAGGRSARIARDLAADITGAQVMSIADMRIAGCTGCAACAKTSPQIRCAISDDMHLVYDALASADELTVVCPLYFSGPPSQFKALLDRLQPHFWALTRKAPKRAATLVVVGDGGDPHGAGPLITIVRSALAVAGFKLGDVECRVGEDA